MGLTVEPMPGPVNDRAAQSLVLSAQPASAINVQSDYTRWLGLRGPRYRIERPQSPPKGAAGRLGEVRHFGNIAYSFEAVVTLARRFARQRV